MSQKYDLTDIGNALSEAMDNPVVEIIRSGAIGVLGLANPVLGMAVGIGNDLLSKYNDFKLSYLLNGLASGCNLEKRLNSVMNPYFRKNSVNIDKTDVLVIPIDVDRNGV